MMAASSPRRLIQRLPSVRGRLTEAASIGPMTLFRDGGVPGVVIRLGRGFSEISVIPGESPRVVAGAGALDLTVAMTARDAGVSGLAFLSGIPGTIGGALRMN